MKLSRLHWKILHPSAQKQFNILKKSQPEEATPENPEVLKDLSIRFNTFQRIKHAPVCFRVTIGSEYVL